MAQQTLQASRGVAAKRVATPNDDVFSPLLDSAVVGIARIDTGGHLKLVNDRFCEIVGRSRDDLLNGTTFSQIIYADERSKAKARIDALFDGREHYTIERPYLRPDGSDFWACVSVTAIRSEKGTLQGSLALVTDITEPKRADEALRDREKRYRELLDAIGVAVYTVDAEGRLDLFNEEAVTLWGHRPERGEYLWSGTWKVYQANGEPMRREVAPVSTALKEGRPVRGVEIQIERPDGTRLNVLPYPTPLYDASGKVRGAVNLLIDITQRKHDEQLKDQFLSLISHELRTPLSTIYGDSYLLKNRFNKISENDRAELLDDLVSESERLQRIIENLLLLTRLEAGASQLEPTQLCILVKEAVAKMNARSPERRIQVRIAQDLPIVLSNPMYIELVMENLLNNAVKYSPPDSLITVEAARADDGVKVVVKDEGIGLQPSELPNLFSVFYRSPRARTSTSGVGIGLAVCKRVIEAQGGRIWARPRRRRGSEFGFELRAAEDPGDSE